MNTFSQALLLAAIALCFPTATQAATILGNMGTALDDASFGIGATGSRGLRFTMGGTSHTLDSIELRLRSSSTSDPRVRVFSDAGGALGSTLATLTYDNVVLNDVTTQTGTFTPGSSLTLNAGVSYWMVLDFTGAGGTLRWRRESGLGETPTGSGASASSTSSHATSDLPTTIDNTATYGNFNINATAVPEPEEYALIAGLGLCAFAVWRRRQAREWAA